MADELVIEILLVAPLKFRACPILPIVGDELVDMRASEPVLPLPERSRVVLVCQSVTEPSRGQ